MEYVQSEEGPVIKLYIPNELTGKETVKYVTVKDLFSHIWDSYVAGQLTDYWTRGMLGEMNLSPCEVFHIMERLQVGRAEWLKQDYMDRSYI